MIDKRDLGTLHFIDKGAVGSVYRVAATPVPGAPPMAYKELLPELAPEARRQALHSMRTAIEFRSALSPADRDDLDEYTTWPTDLVQQGVEVCGLLMPLIPPEFFQVRRLPAGPPDTIVFNLSWLSAKDSQAQAAGVDRSNVRSLPVRIALLAQLAYAIGRLHKHGLVYGDLSLKNVALSTTRPPRIKLLDCDAAAPLSDLSRVQLHSPLFSPPEILNRSQSLQDTATDVFKLGLCVIRGLQQGRGATQARKADGLVGILDPSAVEVIRRAVGDDRSRRPTAKEVFGCLKQSLRAKASPPVVRSASLSRTALVRGQDVQLDWDVTGATEVHILGANGLDVAAPDPQRHKGQHVITPAASGDIVLQVSNHNGTVEAIAGTVQLYDLPPFDVSTLRLPRPVVPQVAPVGIPPVLSRLPAAPAVSTAAHPVRLPEMPALDRVVDALGSLRAAVAPFDRIDTAVFGAGQRMRHALDDCLDPRSHLISATADASTAARRILDTAVADLRDRAAEPRPTSATRKGPT